MVSFKFATLLTVATLSLGVFAAPVAHGGNSVSLSAAIMGRRALQIRDSDDESTGSDGPPKRGVAKWRKGPSWPNFLPAKSSGSTSSSSRSSKSKSSKNGFQWPDNLPAKSP